MKGKGMNTGERRKKPAPVSAGKADGLGLDAAARVLAAGGRVPKKFARLAADAQARPASAGLTLSEQQAQAKLSPARRTAFEVLRLVGEGKGHSDDLLRGHRMEELSLPDRHLATALVMGVLRWQIALDAQLRRLLDRPGQKIAEEVMIALRLGAFQLLHMDRIPAHAALSESVELCRAAGQPHAAGMVNAVLRKVAAARPTSQKREVGQPDSGAPIFERTEMLAERLGHPAWLVERWIGAYGRAAAARICEADQQEPAAGGLFPVPYAGLPQIDDGSRLVAEIAAAAMPRVEGRAARVWDCCAAPGGKTLVLAARLAGAEVLATDVSERRVAAMAARLAGHDYAAEVKTAAIDAARLPASAGVFDLVLCDVPCSGTGTLGRNPEIRLRLTAADLERQAERQRALLTAALARVAPGGRLVYSTCSLEREENETVVEAVAAGWRRVPLEVPEAAGRVVDGALRTLPGVDPCDGFFAVVLERDGDGSAGVQG